MSSTIKVNNIQNLAGDDSGIDLSTNDQIILKTANTTAITVNSSQNVALASTASVSGLLTASSGVAIGGTGSANTLDDYEEGTWTPTIKINDSTSGIAYASRSGAYVKIGELVYVEADITLSSKGSGTGGVKVGSLPFTVDDRTSETSLDGGASIIPFSVGTTGIYTPIGVIGKGGTTDLALYAATSSGGAVSDALQNTKITNSLSIRIGHVYRQA